LLSGARQFRLLILFEAQFERGGDGVVCDFLRSIVLMQKEHRMTPDRFTSDTIEEIITAYNNREALEKKEN
jgi:hypothetical protein